MFSISLGIDDCNTQEKWKTMVNMQNLGGGGQIRCIMGDVQVAEMLQVKLLYLLRVKSFNLGWFSISFVSLP